MLPTEVLDRLFGRLRTIVGPAHVLTDADHAFNVDAASDTSRTTGHRLAFANWLSLIIIFLPGVVLRKAKAARFVVNPAAIVLTIN